MRIKGRDRSRGLLGRLLGVERVVLLGAAAFALLGALCVGVILGQRFQEKGHAGRIRFLTQSPLAVSLVDPLLFNLKAFAVEGEDVPGNFVKALAAGASPDRIVLDVKHEDFQRLARKRAEALQVGVLFTDETDWVPATVSWNGATERARIRLKGDWPDHYSTDKWSLRIKVRGDATLQGMKVFSIQHPATRHYASEWVLFEALRREGVLVPRFGFVDVTINGDHKGVYALEQHFDRHLIESGRQREGPIVKFNEELMWKEYVRLGTWRAEYGSFTSSPVDGWAAEVGHGSAYERAVGLLEGFRRGAYRTTAVFDGPKLAAFVAMRDLSGAVAIPWENLRFYYNPVTSKLEPIGFDNEADGEYVVDKLFCHGGGVRNKKSPQLDNELVRRFFADLDFFALYVQALERFADPAYLDRLLAEIGPALERQLAVLHRDHPHASWSPAFLRRNQAFLRSALAPEKAIHAYHEATQGEDVVLSVGNIQSLPVEVVGVGGPRGASVTLAEPVVLRPKSASEPVAFTTVRLRLPEAPSSTDLLEVRYRLLGARTLRSEKVFPWSPWAEPLKRDWLLRPEPLAAFRFLSVDVVRKTILLKPGAWVLDRPLVLPAGHRVEAGPGVRLDLRRGAKIVSYSALEFLGSEDSPVVVESSDGTGQGLVVIGAGPSKLARVRFENLDAPSGNGYQLTGAVTFYESPVEMEDVLFRRSRSEDALNIFRTRFRMVRTAFASTDRDAFDGDFVEGRVEDSFFTDCGNDALDFSGSSVELDGVRMERIGDKGLSVGEGSEVFGRGVRIRAAEIGVAAKDLSTVALEDLDIAEGGVGFTVYRKKAEFGPGVITVKRLSLGSLVEKHLVEKGSRLTIDGEAVPAVHEKVEGMLYGVRFGRASRR